jgi:hypothetical protein
MGAPITVNGETPSGSHYTVDAKDIPEACRKASSMLMSTRARIIWFLFGSRDEKP